MISSGCSLNTIGVQIGKENPVLARRDFTYPSGWVTRPDCWSLGGGKLNFLS